MRCPIRSLLEGALPAGWCNSHWAIMIYMTGSLRGQLLRKENRTIADDSSCNSLVSN